MANKLRSRGLLALAGLLALNLAGTAAAMPTCEGTYAAESLQPLPARIVVGLDIRDRSPDHLRLGERFLAGIRGAGVTVGPQPTVLLSISSSQIDLSQNRPDNTTAEPVNPDAYGLQGGFQLSLPNIPDTRFATPSTPPSPPLLIFRVEVTAGQPPHISWVANVQCQMIGADDGARAEDLGRIIGGALGRRIDRQPL